MNACGDLYGQSERNAGMTVVEMIPIIQEAMSGVTDMATVGFRSYRNMIRPRRNNIRESWRSSGNMETISDINHLRMPLYRCCRTRLCA